MSEAQDLHTQIAVRLFGWRWDQTARRWKHPDGPYQWGAVSGRLPPAYTTDPAATARVWQWLETRGLPLQGVQFAYHAEGIECVLCYAQCAASGCGASWQEAVCRAALALAEAVDAGEGRG